MDLKLLDAEPTDAEREAIDAVVGVEAANGNRVARARPDAPSSPAPGAPGSAAARRLGDARARSATRRGGSTCRRPTRTASRPSTRCSRSRSVRRRCSTSAPTSPAASPGAEVPDGAHRFAVPRPVRAGAGRSAHDRRARSRARSRSRRRRRRCRRRAGLKLLRRIAEGVDPESLALRAPALLERAARARAGAA